MRNAITVWTLGVAGLVLSLPQAVAAQDDYDPADVELGATEASDVELGISGSAGGSAGYQQGGSGGGDGLRLAMQFRFDGVNVLQLANVGEGLDPDAPLVTPGVRLLDQRLFLGLGLGFNGGSSLDNDSRGGFSLSPLATYDVLRDNLGALSLLGWLNLASLGETEDCDDDGENCTDANNDVFGWGLNLGVGVRGFINQALAIGAEFGWGFMTASVDPNGDSAFGHGIFGTLLFEGSIGL